MNEKLEEQLANIIEKSMNIAEQTGEFIIDQAPDLIRQFYAWHTTMFVLGIVLCLLSILIIHLTCRYFARLEDDKSIYLFDIINIIPLLILFSNIYDLCFILIAPKLYLIEYFL